MGKTPNYNELDRFLLGQISSGRPDVVASAASKFRVTRQAVNKHLRSLTERGAVTASGSTKARKYTLVVEESKRTYPLSPDLQEDEVWREFARPRIESAPSNVLALCQYGFTEMVNNAIDHSEGTFVHCKLRRSPIEIDLRIFDDGVGILKKIKDSMNLEDERHAVLELSKGKLTTDPARHTGEGIFFSSRMFDTFSILSGKLFFCHRPDDSDWLLDDKEWVGGTSVQLVIDPSSQRTAKQVLDRYSALGDDYLFTITHVPVGLARYGDENLVSRSQAKRLMARVEKFREVVLDFAGVNTIGQAFADEIFRVFQQQHLEIKLRWFNANEEVESMIKRAIAQQDRDQLTIWASKTPVMGEGSP